MGPALQRPLPEAHQTLLEADHAPAVGERAGGIAIGETSCHLIREQEPEPDEDLEAEVRVPTRQEAPSGCDSGSHDLSILNVRDVAQHPPRRLSAYLRHG